MNGVIDSVDLGGDDLARSAFPEAEIVEADVSRIVVDVECFLLPWMVGGLVGIRALVAERGIHPPGRNVSGMPSKSPSLAQERRLRSHCLSHCAAYWTAPGRYFEAPVVKL